MAKKSKILATVHIDMQKLLLNRSGKANRCDDDVKRGVGVHIPKHLKKKYEQKQKLSFREEY